MPSPLPAALTLVGLERIVSGVIEDLKNAGTTLEGNGSIVIGGAAAQISSLLNQLKSMVGANFTKPINELTREVKNTANQLYLAVGRLDAILKNQQICMLANAQVFLAGVQTITSGLKSGIPFVADDAPRVDYFQFENHTPGIIPKEGGRVAIRGFDLWEDDQYPPEVVLFDEDRKTKILTIQPEKGNDQNSFTFVLKPDFIRQHQGKNLQLQVIPKEAKWIDWFGPKVLGTYYMVMCIPKIVFSKFKVVAHLQYETDTQVEEIREFKRFGMGNDSCTDRKNYSETKTWDLPAGAVITEVVIRDRDTRNDYNVQFSASNASITASGWLDEATCTELFGIKKLHHDTHWYASAAPRIVYTKKGTVNADMESDFVEMQDNRVDIKIKFPKADNDAETADLFWFEILLDNGNLQKTIYTSPRVDSNKHGDDFGGLQIKADYNPVISAGTSELAVVITLPQCGF